MIHCTKCNSYFPSRKNSLLVVCEDLPKITLFMRIHPNTCRNCFTTKYTLETKEFKSPQDFITYSLDEEDFTSIEKELLVISKGIYIEGKRRTTQYIYIYKRDWLKFLFKEKEIETFRKRLLRLLGLRKERIIIMNRKGLL